MLLLNKWNRKLPQAIVTCAGTLPHLLLKLTFSPFSPLLLASPPSPLKAHRPTQAAFVHCRAQQMVKLQSALCNTNLESLQANTNTLLVLQQRSLGGWKRKKTKTKLVTFSPTTNHWLLLQKKPCSTEDCFPPPCASQLLWVTVWPVREV